METKFNLWKNELFTRANDLNSLIVETRFHDRDCYDQIFCHVHSIKSCCAFMGIDDIVEIANNCEKSLLDCHKIKEKQAIEVSYLAAKVKYLIANIESKSSLESHIQSFCHKIKNEYELELDLSLIFNVEPSKDYSHLVPVIAPLVINSFCHGFSKKSDNRLEVKVEELDQIYISISNSVNNSGTELLDHLSGRGVALKSLEASVELIGGKVHIDNSNLSNFTVCVTIPTSITYKISA